MAKLIRKFIALLGVNPWFTHDKFAHGWLHTLIVIFCRHYMEWYWALFVAVMYGIWYEVFTTDDVMDSLRDIVWNTIGGLIGAIL